jgi:hypothetical protein
MTKEQQKIYAQTAQRLARGGILDPTDWLNWKTERMKAMNQQLDKIREPVRRAGEALRRACQDLGAFICAMADFAAAVLSLGLLEAAKVQAALNEAPPRVRHLATHGKKYRTRKKNINRALREYQRRYPENDKPKT